LPAKDKVMVALREAVHVLLRMLIPTGGAITSLCQVAGRLPAALAEELPFFLPSRSILADWKCSEKMQSNAKLNQIGTSACGMFSALN